MASPKKWLVDRDGDWNEENQSLPVLWPSSGGSEDEADSVEKDGRNDCLVTGRKLPLPRNFPIPDATDPCWQDGVVLSMVLDQLRAQLRLLAEKKDKVLLTTDDSQKVLQRRQWRRSSPKLQRADNDLSQQVSEFATQHPEYSSLTPALREEMWDKRDRDHPNTGSRVDMRRYDVRVATFTDSPLQWPLTVPAAEQLARVGLYYLGVEDRVRCFSCDVKLEEWEGETDPLLRHYLASKHCAFLLQDFPEQLNSFRQQSSSQQAQCYANTSLRLHSFAAWPLSDIVTSYQLASVGFYYTGEETKVVCFSCGLVVREWKRGDVPLLVHCRTNPDCQFIKGIIKGAPDSAPAPTPVLKALTSGATSKPNFADHQIRLKSFKKLSPAFPIPRQRLAETGLFLLRLPDVMKCHSCDVVLQDWVEGNTAVEKHRGVSPDCPFLAEWFPSKLSNSTKQFDPSDLPAAQFNEKELELMAHQSSAPLSSHSASSLTQPTSLPAESFAALSLSDVPNSYTSHTLTESSHTPSLPSPQSLSLSHASTSAYHSMTQPSLLSSADAQATDTYSTLQSSGQSSMESYYAAQASGNTHTSSPHTSSLYTSSPHTSYTSSPHASYPHTSSSHSSLSAGETWGRAVSQPHPQAFPQPLQSVAAAAPHQPSSLSAGAECVVCMDRPLEMVFVPCGHICVCEACSGQIAKCPMCRTRVEMAVKVYFPY